MLVLEYLLLPMVVCMYVSSTAQPTSIKQFYVYFLFTSDPRGHRRRKIWSRRKDKTLRTLRKLWRVTDCILPWIWFSLPLAHIHGTIHSALLYLNPGLGEAMAQTQPGPGPLLWRGGLWLLVRHENLAFLPVTCIINFQYQLPAGE